MGREPSLDEENGYDDALADSFPASDPPAGVIKLGPRQPPSGPSTPQPARQNPF